MSNQSNQSNLLKLNRQSKLYVLKCGEGYACLGFDVMERRAQRLATELGKPWIKDKPSKARYEAYLALTKEAHTIYVNTSRRMTCELHPILNAVLGERVEVTFKDGRKERFQVGKSTGFIPCNLRLARCNSTGGEAIDRDEEIVTVKQIS